MLLFFHDSGARRDLSGFPGTQHSVKLFQSRFVYWFSSSKLCDNHFVCFVCVCVCVCVSLQLINSGWCWWRRWERTGVRMRANGRRRTSAFHPAPIPSSTSCTARCTGSRATRDRPSLLPDCELTDTHAQTRVLLFVSLYCFDGEGLCRHLAGPMATTTLGFVCFYFEAGGGGWGRGVCFQVLLCGFVGFWSRIGPKYSTLGRRTILCFACWLQFRWTQLVVSQSSGLFDWNTLRYWLAKCWHFHGDHSNLIAVLFRSFFVAIYLQLQRNVGAALMEATPIENVTLFFYVGILLFFLSFLISLFLSLSLFPSLSISFHLFPSLCFSWKLLTRICDISGLWLTSRNWQKRNAGRRVDRPTFELETQSPTNPDHSAILQSKSSCNSYWNPSGKKNKKVESTWARFGALANRITPQQLGFNFPF